MALIFNGRLFLDVASLEERVLLKPYLVLDNDSGNSEAFKGADKSSKGSELIDTVDIDTVTPWWTALMAKESLSRYAPRPWGMQPNTSPATQLSRNTWAVFH